MNLLLEQAHKAVATAKEEAAMAHAELATVKAAKEMLERDAEERASAERRQVSVVQHFRRYVELTEEEMARAREEQPQGACGSPSAQAQR